jgi:hypothetical protein
MAKHDIAPNESLNLAYASIDREHAHETAATRRQLVAGAAVTLGGIAALSLPEIASAGTSRPNTPEQILNVAATAEVLATIVNQVALGPQERINIRAAALEEKIHYERLTGDLGGRPLTRKIWVPDRVFSNQTNFLSAVEVGDQIFMNAYLIGTTICARDLGPMPARYAAEFMGAEAVHRALARQSLGKLGNDRAFMKFTQRDNSGAPNDGRRGFKNINTAVKQLQMNGFGFGEQGDTPGRFYDYKKVAPRVQNVNGVNTREFK